MVSWQYVSLLSGLILSILALLYLGNGTLFHTCLCLTFDPHQDQMMKKKFWDKNILYTTVGCDCTYLLILSESLANWILVAEIKHYKSLLGFLSSDGFVFIACISFMFAFTALKCIGS